MLEYLILLAAILFSSYIILFRKKKEEDEEQVTEIVISKPTKPSTTAVEEESSETGFPITILYGSQSGTAEDLAVALKKEAIQNKFKVRLSDLESYPTEDLEREKMVIFLVATYGEGEPPDNARTFYEWLTSDDLPEDAFKDVSYTVFGLGNKTYEWFNRMARVFNGTMKKYGAHCAYPKGEGDDDGCLEDDFNNWKSGLWKAIGEHFNIADIVQESRNASFVRDLKVILHDSSFEIPEKQTENEIDLKNPWVSKIKEIRELHTEKSDRSCMHIEFDLQDKLTYEPGDHLGVYPENQTGLVERLAKRLELNLEQKFSLVGIDNESRVVMGPCTIGYALKSLLDLTSQPRKNVLKVLSENTTNEEDKDFLLKLASGSSLDQGPKTYENWIKKDLRNIVEVLEDVPSVNIPFDLLFEVLPRLAPRYYSISSAISLCPQTVSATAVLVNYQKPTNRLHDGVCTTWFKQKFTKENQQLEAPIFVRKSTFRLPPQTKFPIIMIGPGTGLAPFRGFIQQRRYQMANAAPDTVFGESFLFFGCRTRDQDYIYQEELEKAVEDKVLTELSVAFSREQENKVYVQDKLLENGAKVWELIDSKGGYIYVCGDAHKMAKDVANALHKIGQTFGKLGEQQSQTYFHSLQGCGRYLQDVWY